jgi:DNA-binding HxlR family transcriptional regulator
LQVKIDHDSIEFMVDKKTKSWAGCPVRFGMSQFGDKWSFLIIRDLMFKGRKYYNEFLEAGEGISTNILASRLVDLECNGIVNKCRDPLKRSKYIYSLTDKGIALMPMMLAMIDWAEKYDSQTEVPTEFINKLRDSSDKLQQELLKQLKHQ